MREGETVLLVPELYETAHYRHMLFRKFCDVRLPGRADVLHLTAPLPIRMRGTPTVTTIHDLAPILHPDFTPDDKAEFIARVRTSARLSDLVLTVSEAARGEILDTLDLSPEKVVALHQPVDIAPATPADDETIARTLQRYGLTRGDYIFWVGAIEPKKNVRRLIEAYAESKLDMPLVLAGRPAWFADQQLGWMETALAPAIRQRVRLIGHVSGGDLRRLYAGAMMFAFPSLYEGFGLPALEAMTMGCPVVASTTPALAEICGEAALLADPLDRDSIREKLEQMAGDAALRQRLSAAGRDRAKAFSFETYVDNLGKAYARIGIA
jgi:glycosyltransferase involved in cell wall biosynthesis